MYITTTLDIYYALKNSYEESTLNSNFFAKRLDRIKWDSTFEADGEYYFILDDMTFTTPSLDPFNMPWKPSAIFRDGCVLEF